MTPNLAKLSTQSRRWRTGMLIVCALAALLAVDDAVQCSPLMPWCSTTMGFQDDYGTGVSFVVTSVDPNGSAKRLRSGDRIELPPLSFAARWRLRDVYKGYGGVAGELWRYSALDGARVVQANIRVRRVLPSWGDWINWTQAFASLWGVGFVALLMSRRPDLAEARFLSLIVLFLLSINDLTGTLAAWPVVEFILHFIGGSFLWVPALCLTLYAARVARPLSRVRTILSIFSIVASLVVACEVVVLLVGGFVFALPVLALQNNDGGSTLIALLASFLCLIAGAIAARRDEQHRALWVIAGVAPIWLYYICINIVWNFARPSVALMEALLTLAALWLPVALTYAVVSRRCVDIGYAINRALVFGFLSIFVLAIFIVVEYAITEWIQNASRSTSIVINCIVALALGLSIRFVHRRIESFVDRVFFRRRHENEAALRRFAREAPFITAADVLVARAKFTIERYGEASSAQIVMERDVDENDPAVLTMRTSHEGVDLHRYDTVLDGELGFPITMRGRFIGVLVCGPKRDGEAYAPNEREAFDAIAHALGIALDSVQQSREVRTDMLDLLLEIRDLLKSRSGERLTP